jgi:hypothetical protein
MALRQKLTRADTLTRHLGIAHHEVKKHSIWLLPLPPTTAPPASAVADHGFVFSEPRGQFPIYEVRPVQCPTYPFWPSPVDAQEDWDDEAVLPDDALTEVGADESCS